MRDCLARACHCTAQQHRVSPWVRQDRLHASSVISEHELVRTRMHMHMATVTGRPKERVVRPHRPRQRLAAEAEAAL